MKYKAMRKILALFLAVLITVVILPQDVYATAVTLTNATIGNYIEGTAPNRTLVLPVGSGIYILDSLNLRSSGGHDVTAIQLNGNDLTIIKTSSDSLVITGTGDEILKLESLSGTPALSVGGDLVITNCGNIDIIADGDDATGIYVTPSGGDVRIKNCGNVSIVSGGNNSVGILSDAFNNSIAIEDCGDITISNSSLHISGSYIDGVGIGTKNSTVTLKSSGNITINNSGTHGIESGGDVDITAAGRITINNDNADSGSYGIKVPNSNTIELEALHVVATGPGNTYSEIPDITSAPSAPTNLTATPGDKEINITWAAPVSDGGQAITGYEVQLDSGGWNSATGMTHTFTGLSNGTQYTLSVRAVNSVGKGLEESTTAIPTSTATVPSAPTNLVATPGDEEIAITWAAPANDGGQAVTGYEVQLDSGGWNTTVGMAHSFTGLNNGTQYTLSVRAINSVGEGVATSTIAIPLAPPVTDNPAAYVKDSLSLDLNGTKTGTIHISLGQSGTGTMAARAEVASDNNTVATATPTQVDSNRDITVEARSVGSTNITVTFYDAQDNVMSGSFGGPFTVSVINSYTSTPTPTPTPSGSRDSGSNSSRQDGVNYTTAQSGPHWHTNAEIEAAIAKAKQNGDDFVLLRWNSSFGIRAAQWKLFGDLSLRADTTGSPVQVRVSIPEPSKLTKDVLLSGAVKGTTVDRRKAFFEKWFANQVQVVHLEQAGSFGQAVEIAALVDLTGMDTANLHFYSYDKASNTYKRIESPNYWIDKNGYLHFTTELAGDIIVSEGLIERK